ncbi:Acetyltransferase (GNAT) domain-containing protein [Rhizobiales bacterium GAS191]|nr:Acetyltransferase (GNAT) domain-containing protein [Rhizobiales bacterium GAS191]
MSGKDATSPFRNEQICLRAMEEADLGAAHSLSVAVGWPHRHGDWRAVFEIGHGYCAHDAIGRLVGTAMWWPIGAAFATIGMVIVAPSLRGQGLGRQMMSAVQEAAQGRTLQLNATLAGMKLYKSQGFRAIGAVRQYQGVARPAKWHSSADILVRPSTAEDWASIAELDRAAHGVDRRNVLRALTGDAAGAIGERDARVTGFAFCRPFGRGYVIGPIVAFDEETAIALAAPFVMAHAGYFVRADIPEGMTGLSCFLEECGLLPAGGGTTMIKGRAPRRSGRVRVFGLINQAIG